MRMRKFTLLLALCFLTIACNLPTAKKITPTVDFIATNVAETLEVLPTRTPLILQITATSSVMPEPSQATPTITGTPLPTPSGDPRSWLGNPSKTDTLDSPQGFGLAGGYEDEAANLAVGNGVMTMNSRSATGWRTWRVRPPELSNAYIEATFRTLNCTGNDQYGINLRAPNYDTGFGYYFAITCDGRYQFFRSDSSGTTTLASLSPETHILTGNGQTNRLGVMSKGDKLTLFINGNLVQEFEDPAFSSGFFGVFMRGFSGNLTVELDEISYWNNL